MIIKEMPVFLIRSLKLILIFAALSGSLFSMPVQLVKGVKYVKINDFLKTVNGIKYEWDALSLTGKLSYKNNWVRVEIGKSFYTGSGMSHPLKSSPIYHEDTVLIPLELAEELFSELDLKIRYKFNTDKINIQTSDTFQTQNQEKSDFRAKQTLDFIVIDPGHGGYDPGAFANQKTLVEKNITLKASRFLYLQLKKAFPEIDIYITRYNDTFVNLETRANIANKRLGENNFGIFISIHCNATLSKKINGYEVYYLAQNSGNNNEREVMIRENDEKNEPKYVEKLQSLLLNSQIQSESKTLARAINSSLMSNLNKLVKSRGVKKADFVVLRGVLMPAILIEMGYLSNKNESAVLNSDIFQKSMSKGIILGIKRFISQRPRL
ncbi:MAG: N-acetylmuramoyl-L-alanine amidase [Spirochaetia bacterium]|nr:N-acetylmuramoyl-L-alanine amidase [Spirochaetia bacterium]